MKGEDGALEGEEGKLLALHWLLLARQGRIGSWLLSSLSFVTFSSFSSSNSLFNEKDLCGGISSSSVYKSSCCCFFGGSFCNLAAVVAPSAVVSATQHNLLLDPTAEEG